LTTGAPPALPPAVDGDRLVALIVNHRLAGALGPLVPPETLPAAAAARLDAARREARKRTTVLLLELERILPALAAIGAEPLVLKGAALALDVYRAPEQRWFVDLDILIRADRRSAALAALAKLGYRRHEAGEDPEFYARHHFHHILLGPQGACVELHWALTLPHSLYRYDLERLRAEAREITLDGGRIAIPSPVDHILHGSLQGVAEGFGNLRRIVDVGLLAARLDGRDRTRLVERAYASRLATALWQQFRLLERIGRIEPPRELAELRPAGGLRRRLLDSVLVDPWRLVAGSGVSGAHVELIHWCCVPTRRDRVREIGRFFWPSDDDWFETAHAPGIEPSKRRRVRLVLSRLKQLTWLAGSLVLRRPTPRWRDSR
jgi:hypothetical protein